MSLLFFDNLELRIMPGATFPGRRVKVLLGSRAVLLPWIYCGRFVAEVSTMNKVEIERARTVCAVLNETRSGVFQVFGVNATGFIVSHDTGAPGAFAPRTLTRFDVDGGTMYLSDASEPLPWHHDAIAAWEAYKGAGQ